MFNIFQSNKIKIYEDEIYCLLNYGQNKKALDKINRCYDQSYVTPSIMALESVALARLGYHQRAITLCNELFEIATTDYNIFHLLVESFRALANYSRILDLCTIALKYNNTEEYLKILLNTYIRMFKFDLAQSIALKIYIKTKNQSIGIVYCILAIIKEDSKSDSIEVAQKFMNKLDFTEFKPQIRFYLELSLLLALQDYDKIIDYFKDNNSEFESDQFELLLFSYVKKQDYQSAINLLHNYPNKSLNVSIYELELSLISNVVYNPSDLYLKLEYIKRRNLYKYLISNKKIPNSPDELWSNSNDLTEYLNLLKSQLIKNIEKPTFLKFASNFLPFVNLTHDLINVTSSPMAIINMEKLKIAGNFYESASIDLIDDRIEFFTNMAKSNFNIEIIFILIEFHLIKYYRNKLDLNPICQLLNIIDTFDPNCTFIYNILIDLYGILGCIDKAKSLYIKMNYRESLISTQTNRFLHFSLHSLQFTLVEKCYDSYLNWFYKTRGYISNSLVSCIEKSPHMIPQLCKLDQIHSNSALFCYNLSIKLLCLINSDMEKLISNIKIYHQQLTSFVSGRMHWYCRNTTSCFSHFAMPTFKFSCLNSIPLVDLLQSLDDVHNEILPMNTTYFEEPEFIFPRKFYRKYNDFSTINDLLTKSYYFPKNDQNINRHTKSALYKFNLDTFKKIEFEALIFVDMILLIYNIHEKNDIAGILLSLKNNIASYLSHFNNSDLIFDLSEKILNSIESNNCIEISKTIDKCLNLLELNFDLKKLDLNTLTWLGKFMGLIKLIPCKLLSILKWVDKFNNMKLELEIIDKSMENLSNKITNIIDAIEKNKSSQPKMDETYILVCRSNISILKRFIND